MNEIEKFNFENCQLRIITDDNGSPFFCALDVTAILGYVNGRDSIERHCKSDGVVKYDIIDSLGRLQNASFISEPNLYRLILKSNMPNAIRFESWVCEDVLPTIRKTGQYNALPDFNNPAIAARAWADEFEKRQLAENKINELAPKAETFDKIMASDSCIDIGQAAKILNLGYGRNVLFEKLRNDGVLTALNIPYKTYIDRGYFRCIETPFTKGDKIYVHVKALVTQKGINWLSKIYKNE
jgi:prophage antirepressor-like protein